MKLSRWLLVSAAAPLVIAGCGGLGEAMNAHTDVVARAAGSELRVEEAARLLASNPQIPADPQVVRALADVWVDYTLLAKAAAEDPELEAIDVDAFTLPAREQAVVMKLREQVLDTDTTFTDEELEAEWATQGPGIEVRARHILLRIPPEATPAQRDSIRQLAAELRERAVAGEDFAELATEYSQDPGSAARGGDLGFFGRGRMVAPFEEAAFGLEPGEVSEVVESPFGYHVIMVEERRQPELAEERDEFRQFLVGRARQEAETAYLDSLSAAAEVELSPGGLAVVRELAGRPNMKLEGRAAQREIATYEGGEFTSGEFVEFIRTQQPQMQSAFSTATDEQLESVVQQLVRKELLLREAEELGIELTDAEQQEMRTRARQSIQEVVQATGIAEGGATDAALEDRVMSLLEDAIAQRRQLVPLGSLSYVLRDLYRNEVNEGAFPQVIDELEEIRATQPAPQPTTPPAAPQPAPQQPAG